MDVKVSVITLSYNSMDYIYETIQSVLVQTYEKIELIIADDNSEFYDKKGIIDYIEKNKKNNISNYKVYQNPANCGTVKNLNAAIKNATGEIIINLSAGDMFFHENVVTEIVKEFLNTQCNILCTRRAFFKKNINYIKQMMPDDYEIYKIKKFKTAEQEYIAFYTGYIYRMASGSALSYRRDFIKQMGYFDEDYFLWEDGPFFVNYILSNGMINYNYDIISIYYRYGGVSTGKMPESLKKDSLLFLQKGLSDSTIKGFSRRQVKYRYEKVTNLNNSSTWCKIWIYIKYLDVSIMKVFYYLEKMLFKLREYYYKKG